MASDYFTIMSEFITGVITYIGSSPLFFALFGMFLFLFVWIMFWRFVFGR